MKKLGIALLAAAFSLPLTFAATQTPAAPAPAATQSKTTPKKKTAKKHHHHVKKSATPATPTK